MSGYLLVMIMLVVALTAVLLAFLLDLDETKAPADQIPLNERGSEPSQAVVNADPNIGVEEGTNDDGSASI